MEGDNFYLGSTNNTYKRGVCMKNGGLHFLKFGWEV